MTLLYCAQLLCVEQEASEEMQLLRMQDIDLMMQYELFEEIVIQCYDKLNVHVCVFNVDVVFCFSCC